MSSTFIARRWNTSQKAYVDSKNNKILIKDAVDTADTGPDFFIPSIPPSSGSTPFLALPTELRLQIYGYLTENDKVSLKDFHRSFDLPSHNSVAYAYLWRSPGRVTKPNAISKQVIKLFRICHLMRVELIDACFNDRTFVLEASLYKQDVGGLYVLPSSIGPTAWVKKLLIMTVVEFDGKVKGVADLRPLQQMVNLKELRIVFSARAYSLGGQKADVLCRPDGIFKAILECVPTETIVHFETDKKYARGCGRLQSMDHTDSTLESVMENQFQLSENKGHLSGSTVDHSLCGYLDCLESLSCVNSHVQLPLHVGQLSQKPWVRPAGIFQHREAMWTV